MDLLRSRSRSRSRSRVSVRCKGRGYRVGDGDGDGVVGLEVGVIPRPLMVSSSKSWLRLGFRTWLGLEKVVGVLVTGLRKHAGLSYLILFCTQVSPIQSSSVHLVLLTLELLL